MIRRISSWRKRSRLVRCAAAQIILAALLTVEAVAFGAFIAAFLGGSHG